MRNPRPDAYVTMAGMPITFSDFRWPFHRSVSGADTYIVHGVVHVADGTDSLLHAKVSASMTVTFAEIVPAPEQPYAETFIYSAIRKTLDQGQLELLKSGNRQPVPVTTRYYSRWQKKFFFTDTDDESRQEFLLAKVFWLSGVLGNSQPVWIADPRDAQYLNTTAEELMRAAAVLAAAGLVTLSDEKEAEFAAATPALLAREAEFRGTPAAGFRAHQADFQRGNARRPHQYVAEACNSQPALRLMRSRMSLCTDARDKSPQALPSLSPRASWAWRHNIR